MLTNAKQYKASKCAAIDLKEMLAAEPDPNIPKKLVEANRRKLRNKLESIEQQILEYEKIVKQGSDSLDIDSLEEKNKTTSLGRGRGSEDMAFRT